MHRMCYNKNVPGRGTKNTLEEKKMDHEKMLRYEVTTVGNCFLHGFEEWQDAVDYANALDIRVKIWDSACGVCTDWYND